MPTKKIKKITKKTIKPLKKKKAVLSSAKKIKKPIKSVRQKKIKKVKKVNKIWIVLPIIFLILIAGYFGTAYFYFFWPFTKDYPILEERLIIKKEIPADAARLDWDDLEIISDEKISDTDSEKKNLVTSSWASDSSRLIYLDEDKSLSADLDGNYPWKGKLYIFDDVVRKNLANFFPRMTDNDLEIVGRSAIDMFNNERSLIKTDFNGDKLVKIDLNDAISYDLSTDGRKLALVKNDGEVLIKDLQTGQRKSFSKEKLDDKVSFINPRWSHDGKKIAFLRRLNSKDVYPSYENWEVGYLDSEAKNLADFVSLGATYLSDEANANMTWSNNDKFLLDDVSNNVYAIETAKTLISNDEDSWQRMKSLLSPASDKVAVFEYYRDKMEEDFNHVIVNFYVMSLDGSKRIELLNKEGDINSGILSTDFIWSPDGEKIVYTSDKKLYMVGADGTSVRQLSKEDKEYQKLFWANDGLKIAYVVGNEVGILNLGQEEKVAVSMSGEIGVKIDEKITETLEEEYLQGQTWSPDSGNILVERFSKTNEGLGEPPIFYYVVNLENKKAVKVSNEIYSLSGSYKTRWLNNNEIVYDNLTDDGLKIIWADKEGNVLQDKKINEWNKNWFGWDISSDGKEIITIDSGNKIYLHKKGESDAKILYEGDSKDSVSWIRWSPNKKYIVLLKGEEDVWLLKLDGDKVSENKRLGGNQVFGRDGGFDPESFVLWSPDSRKVVVQDSGNVLDVDKGIVVENLLPDYSVQFGVAPVSSDYKWSLDSQYIAYCQNNNLYFVKYDGYDKKTLAENNISAFDWNFDSSKIFFADDKGISVVNLDGSENKRLIEKDGKYSYLKLSADGSKLAYVKNGEVWVASLN